VSPATTRRTARWARAARWPTVGGVCTGFDRPVAALTPFAVHPALTVTVEDLDGLAELLRSRCAIG
jgi:hypothetical protein